MIGLPLTALAAVYFGWRRATTADVRRLALWGAIGLFYSGPALHALAGSRAVPLTISAWALLAYLAYGFVFLPRNLAAKSPI